MSVIEKLSIVSVCTGNPDQHLLETVQKRLENPTCRIPAYGTVSAKIAPRLICYKNASRLNRYNVPTENAIDFLFSTLHTTPVHYEVLKIGSR